MSPRRRKSCKQGKDWTRAERLLITRKNTIKYVALSEKWTDINVQVPDYKQGPWRQRHAWDQPTIWWPIITKLTESLTEPANFTGFGKLSSKNIILTCCLKSIFSSGDFLVRLDKNDKGKTKAALPTKTSPKRIELTITDVFGLEKNEKVKSFKHRE